MLSSSVQGETRQEKRRRLNHACDLCRRRKIRCDDRRPDCTNCLKANARCITRDLRNSSTFVVRHEAQAQHGASSLSLETSLHKEERHSTPGHSGNATASTITGRHGKASSLHPLSSASPASDRYHASSIVQENLRSPASSVTGSESENEAPPPGQGLAAARLPIFPRFVNGNSLYILTQWLDLAFARLNHSYRFSHLCREAKGYMIQDSASNADLDQALSDKNTANATLANFLHSVHQMFPIFSHAYWSSLVFEKYPELPVHRILRALVVAVHRGPNSRRNLNKAFSQLNILVQTTTLESLIAFILMIIAFRGHDDAETAVRVLSVASTVANMMGLQRSSTSHTTDDIVAWWTLFTLDKILAVELERPALIKSRECFQKAVDSGTLLHHLIELAKVQESIIDRMFQQRGMEESDESTVEEIILHKVQTASELDSLLLDWQLNLPHDIQISDPLLCDSDSLPGISFLAIQFHQT